MRMNSSLALLGCIGILFTSLCQAGEFQRIHIDLVGDGKLETVTFSTAPTTKAWRKKLIVRIGTSEFLDDFFAADGDLPDVRVVAIDRKRPQRQLLVGTPEAASCIFHLLTYSKGKLIRLLRFDAGPDCQPPAPLGNGHVNVGIWQGFWSKTERYALSKDGDILTAEPKDEYDVGVSGFAGKALQLQGAECVPRTATPGVFIRVKKYDTKQNRYRLESADGGCGWIPAADLNTTDEKVMELPWAG